MKRLVQIGEEIGIGFVWDGAHTPYRIKVES